MCATFLVKFTSVDVFFRSLIVNEANANRIRLSAQAKEKPMKCALDDVTTLFLGYTGSAVDELTLKFT